MPEEYRIPPIISVTERTELGTVALWANIAEEVNGVTARVFDLSNPEDRAAAIGAFDRQRDIYKAGGAVCVAMAEQNEQGVIQLVGTAKDITKLKHAARASETD